MATAFDVTTRVRLDGAQKLRAAGCERPGDSFLWFEHVECGDNPMEALRRVSQMGDESRRDIGRRAVASRQIQLRDGGMTRHTTPVYDATTDSRDADRDSYLARKYGMRVGVGRPALGEMRVDEDGNELGSG